MSADATIVTGRRIADRYRLVGERRDGAWDAVDETLRRDVVVALLSGSANNAAKAHFTAEARCLASLNHRNVVATFDTGIDGDGTSYRVDELAGGAPLDAARVTDAQRVNFALQIARAVAAAHDKGLVHGQLTAASVLVVDNSRLKVRGLQLPRDHERAATSRQDDIDAVTTLIAALAPATTHPLRSLVVGWRGNKRPASVATIVTALAAIPDESDDAPIIESSPTPTRGVPRPAATTRRWPIVGAVALTAVAALLLVVVLPGRRTPGDFSGATRRLALVASSFDPEVSPPTENEEEARLAVDGNPATTWSTDLYRRAHFANLKSGVGLVLQTDNGNAAEFGTLALRSPTIGWTYEIYAAAQKAASLAGWGQPIAKGTFTNDRTVALNEVQGTALLVWISDTGENRQVRIGEITVQGRV